MRLIKKFKISIFFINSILLTLLAGKMPKKRLCHKKWPYKEGKWEKDGKLYEKIFSVKKWKNLLPELSDFIKSAFSKRHLKQCTEEYLASFLTESCRSEFTHWCIIFSTAVFFIWGDLLTGIKMALLAIALNLPYIIIQRYNRPRITRLLRKIQAEKIFTGLSLERNIQKQAG